MLKAKLENEVALDLRQAAAQSLSTFNRYSPSTKSGTGSEFHTFSTASLSISFQGKGQKAPEKADYGHNNAQ